MLSQEEIDSLLSSLSVGLEQPLAGPEERSNESSANESLFEKRNYKLYNFRRPDKFSKDHLRALQTIHESFARQLGLIMTAYLRMTVEIDGGVAGLRNEVRRRDQRRYRSIVEYARRGILGREAATRSNLGRARGTGFAWPD